MRAQIAITRNGITQARSDNSPPEGGVLARRTNGDFLISLHRHVSEAVLVQMMRSLRALDPGFEMSLEMAGNITRHLSRQDICLRLALRALGILERVHELSDGRERSVSELEGVIASLSQSALSQHLARLRRANIVRTRRESQTI